MPRHPSPRRVKLHFNYTVKELARLLNRTGATIRTWISDGLAPIDGRRPLLVTGAEVRRYLDSKRSANRHRCGVGELFCVACRQPRAPAFGEVEYIPITHRSGNLRGICPACANLMHRRARADRVDQVRGPLSVVVREGEQRMNGETNPSDNPHFKTVS
jgi:hypothetical protein